MRMQIISLSFALAILFTIVVVAAILIVVHILGKKKPPQWQGMIQPWQYPSPPPVEPPAPQNPPQKPKMTEAERRAFAARCGVEYFCVENCEDDILIMACEGKKEWDDKLQERLREKRESAFYKQTEEILRLIDVMEGGEFENFFSYLLQRNGFNSNVTKLSGDHGADVIAEKDGVRYAFQCKRYDGNVGNRAVQEALAGKVYYRTDKAAVVTNSKFTPQAEEDAQRLGVELWDRDNLILLIEETRRQIASQQEEPHG